MKKALILLGALALSAVGVFTAAPLAASANPADGTFTASSTQLVIDWGGPIDTVDVNLRWADGTTKNYHPNTGDEDGKLTLVYADLGWPAGIPEWVQVHAFNCHIGEAGSPGNGTVCKTVAGPPPIVVPFAPYETAKRWLIPATWPSAQTPTYQAAIFPQDELTGALPCGRWSQDDTYLIENAAEEAIWLGLGATLEQGEDSAIYKAHTFTYGGDCPPVEEPEEPTLPAPANPAATIAVDCLSATVTATNELGENPEQLTSSVIVYVNGVPVEFLAPLAGEEQVVELELKVGDTIAVRTGPAHGDTLLGEATIKDDCIVVPPVTEDPPATDTPTEVTTFTKPLAHAGPDGFWTGVAVAAGLSLLGLAALAYGIFGRRRA